MNSLQIRRIQFTPQLLLLFPCRILDLLYFADVRTIFNSVSMELKVSFCSVQAIFANASDIQTSNFAADFPEFVLKLDSVRFSSIICWQEK